MNTMKVWYECACGKSWSRLEPTVVLPSEGALPAPLCPACERDCSRSVEGVEDELFQDESAGDVAGALERVWSPS